MKLEPARVNRSVLLTLLLYFLLTASARHLAAQGQAVPPVSASNSVEAFVDATERLGVNFQYQPSHNSKKYLLETMGAGVALFDYDNDGRLDIYLVNGAPLSDPTPKGTVPQKNDSRYWNRLYHQKPDGTFEDVTEKAGLEGTGYGMGVAVGDFDNDGFEDIYVAAYGGNKLYHNNRNGTFSDVTQKAGKEGYRAYCHPDYFKPISPLVFHNNKDGTFTEVAQKVDLGKPGKGLGVAIADYDRDGHIDLFIANDSMVEFLYHNKGDGTFEDVGLASEVAVDMDGRTYAGMGVDFADYNNDGWPDIVVTDLANQRYALYQNNGEGSFSYASNTAGIGPMTMGHSGWGVRFLDYDNDGWKDLLIAQGHDLDTIELNYPNLHYREPMLLARNTGRGFVDVSAQSGSVFRQAWVSRGMAIGDLDNDGRLDAVVTTNDGSVHVLHNETVTRNHWILLKLVGHKSNRDGIGAEVTLVRGSGPQYATVSTASSYLSASDKRVHFGLGQENVAQRIEIRWPSGIRQTLKDIPADQILQIDEPAAPSTPQKP